MGLQHDQIGHYRALAFYMSILRFMKIYQIAILQLIEQKRISLDTAISEIIPELKDPVVLDDPFGEESTFEPAKTKITLAHLLNHSSGLFVREKRDPSYALPTLLTSGYGPTDPVGLFYTRNKV